MLSPGMRGAWHHRAREKGRYRNLHQFMNHQASHGITEAMSETRPEGAPLGSGPS